VSQNGPSASGVRRAIGGRIPHIDHRMGRDAVRSHRAPERGPLHQALTTTGDTTRRQTSFVRTTFGATARYVPTRSGIGSRKRRPRFRLTSRRSCASPARPSAGSSLARPRGRRQTRRSRPRSPSPRGACAAPGRGCGPATGRVSAGARPASTLLRRGSDRPVGLVGPAFCI
jgi:hypothetical protein